MILTNWGYSLVDADAMPGLITIEKFEELTGERFKGDIRIASTIAAVEASIRNFVGWHLATNQLCEVSLSALDGRIIKAGRDLLIQLPAKHVTEIESIKVNDNEIRDFKFKTNGNVRIFDTFIGRRDDVVIRYRAGLSTDALGGVQELVANRTSRALSQSYGVQSEASGGVSITYNASFVAGQGAGALVDDNREVLIPYKLVEVF